jgi:kinesin family member 6/9
MKRNSVKVCIRTRPTQNFAQDNIAIDEEHSTIQINSDRGDDMIVAGGPNNKQNLFKFRFDHVFHNASQTTVYDLFARDTVQGVVDGINGAIMSYGQTGSGKSFTVIAACKLFRDFHSYLFIP